MRIFPWLLTLALASVSLAAWIMAEFTVRSMRDLVMDPPYFTGLIIVPHGWLFAAPLPWVIYSAMLTVRRNPTPTQLFVFTGVWCLFMALLISALVIAVSLPFLPRHS